MPSARTSARLAPLAPSPRNETPCDVGLAVWLPERRRSENPGTWRSLSSVVSAPHSCNCCERTTAASGCASTSSTPVGRIEVRVEVTSRLCCTVASVSVMARSFWPACHAVVLVVNPGALTITLPFVAVIPVKTKVPSGWVTRLNCCSSARNKTCARATTAPARSLTVPRTSCCGAPHASNCRRTNASAKTAGAPARPRRGMCALSCHKAVGTVSKQRLLAAGNCLLIRRDELLRILRDESDKRRATGDLFDALRHASADAIPQPLRGQAFQDRPSLVVGGLIAALSQVFQLVEVERLLTLHLCLVLQRDVVAVVVQRMFLTPPLPGSQHRHPLQLGVVLRHPQQVAASPGIGEFARRLDAHEAYVVQLVNGIVEQFAQMSVEVRMRAVERRRRTERNPNVVSVGEKQCSAKAEAVGQIAQRIVDPVRILQHGAIEKREAPLANAHRVGTLAGRGQQRGHKSVGRVLRHVVIEVARVIQQMRYRRRLFELFQHGGIVGSEILQGELSSTGIEAEVLSGQSVVCRHQLPQRETRILLCDPRPCQQQNKTSYPECDRPVQRLPANVNGLLLHPAEFHISRPKVSDH